MMSSHQRALLRLETVLGNAWAQGGLKRLLQTRIEGLNLPPAERVLDAC